MAADFANRVFRRKRLYVTSASGRNFRVARHDDQLAEAKVRVAQQHLANGYEPTQQRDDGTWVFPDV